MNSDFFPLIFYSSFQYLYKIRSRFHASYRTYKHSYTCVNSYDETSNGKNKLHDCGCGTRSRLARLR